MQGKKEYSKCEHKIRFTMDKKDAVFTMVFHVIFKCASSQLVINGDRVQLISSN